MTTSPHVPRLPNTAAPSRGRFWAHTVVFASRNLSHVRQIPEKLVDDTIQPLMFTLLFAYVFGGAIDVAGSSYREYLIGGILVQSLAFGLVRPATSVATDLGAGVIDRFRALPAARFAYLSGHFVAELVGMCIAITVLLGSGLLVGWRTHNDLSEVLLAILLLVVVASVMISLGTLIGLVVRSPDAVTGVAFSTVFPLTMISNAFVPVESLPRVLQHLASWNPVSILVAAVRELFGNTGGRPAGDSWPLTHPVVSAFVVCGVVLGVTVPLCLARYRARTTD